MTLQTIAGLYLVLIFVMMKFSYNIAARLIQIGAVVGGLLLIKPFRAEACMIITIIAVAWIIKRFFLQR